MSQPKCDLPVWDQGLLKIGPLFTLADHKSWNERKLAMHALGTEKMCVRYVGIWLAYV